MISLSDYTPIYRDLRGAVEADRHFSSTGHPIKHLVQIERPYENRIEKKDKYACDQCGFTSYGGSILGIL